MNCLSFMSVDHINVTRNAKLMLKKKSSHPGSTGMARKQTCWKETFLLFFKLNVVPHAILYQFDIQLGIG